VANEFIRAGESTQRETEERVQASRFLYLRGRLAELDGDRVEAESRYRDAISLAERHGARLAALQAATRLARLYHAVGSTDAATATLRPIYESFEEGFDYPDLVQARAVLEGGGCGDARPC
jgi:hypothetical protein